jgi:hypothetical protein
MSHYVDCRISSPYTLDSEGRGCIFHLNFICKIIQSRSSEENNVKNKRCGSPGTCFNIIFHKVFFFIFLWWIIMPSLLSPFRINYKIINLIECWWDSLDGLARRKAAACIGQHRHKINAGRHPCLKWDWKPRTQCLSGRRSFLPYAPLCLWSAAFLKYQIVISWSD